ncbi:MAG: 2-dehydropantoate 2-reductase [Ectothiorhodospiraceae bacterium]|nr:2-dehydropantoate 2-reductase [Ectothiorhodospiraceae bacterium]
MRITVIGAGAMGGSFGAALALNGHEVSLVDVWEPHVAAIRDDGLRLRGALGEHRLRIPISTEPPGGADVAIVFVDSNATRDVIPTVASALAPDGFAVTFQNGVGNVETLQAGLGRARVVGGSSMCSAAVLGPGDVILTHLAPTSIGEPDGGASDRVEALARALRDAGLESKVDASIMTTIWQKFLLNAAINALCAATGLRLGEIARLPELDALQDRVMDEAMAVTRAKGIRVSEPDIRATIKAQCRLKFSKPSMLQHIEAAKRTEIDAINGALVREGRALGVPTPYNEAVVALLKGRELARQRAIAEPAVDYAAWEALAQSGDAAAEPPVA